jgi:hypothetical protein
MMWEAIAKLAGLGILIVERLWPPKAETKEAAADPTDIATAQSSGYAADRSGKAAGSNAKRER